MAAGSVVTEATDATFASAVLERSRSVPVVVDFWAPWCGPCKILGPIIERVAEDFAGQVDLVKLNTDENPRTAAAYRIQGIPAVKAFVNGQVAQEFAGAHPEPQVRAFFAKLTPGPGRQAIQRAEQLAASGDLDGAEREYRAALQAEPANADTVVGLAAFLVRRGEREEAEQVLDRVPRDRRAKALKHRLFLEEFAARHAEEDLEDDARRNPNEPRARYRYGVLLAAREQYEAALEELLESVRLERGFADGAARKAMLAMFDLLGLESPVARDYQRRLSMLLF